MKIRFPYLVLILFILGNASWLDAQSEQSPAAPIRCYATELMEAQILANPELEEQHRQRDEIVRRYVQNNPDLNSRMTTNYVIPVVVYVVHNNGPENISDQRIHGQIDALNDHFLDSGIQFCLATTEGATPLPGTGSDPGIIRIQSTLTNTTINNTVPLSNLSTLSPERYMRIWVVNSIVDASAVLGFATFPQATLTSSDGIVMRYEAFGDIATCGCTDLLPAYNEGKTLSHEVGHYLGLYHTFHGGCAGLNSETCDEEGDQVCDTPPVAVEHYGCPSADDSCNETPNASDLLNNYMDYTDDACINAFTEGQGIRMASIIANFRSTLVSNPNHIYTGVPCAGDIFAEFTASNYNACTGETTVTFEATLVPGVTYTWNFGDGSPEAMGISTSHVFANAGSVPVTLTVSDGTESVSFGATILVEDCQAIESTEGIWYFQAQSGLNFSSGVPEYDSGADVNNTMTNPVGETAAVQSNDDGVLLFYTNGESIWDNTHALIASNIGGNYSSASGAIIVPNPAASNQYYIFTTRAFSGGLATLKYSLVAVNGLNTSVISTDNPIIAPAGFASHSGALSSSEGVTAIAGCDGEYWIITLGRISSTERSLVVYRLSNTGLSFESSLPVAGISSPFLTLEAAPSGKKIAMTTFTNSASFGVQVFDFDRYSGILSNQTSFSSSNAYGLSFSPDSKLLYATETSNGNLLQYQVNASSPSATETIVGTIESSNSTKWLGMQRGPDNKIYISKLGFKQLAVIHQPNNTAIQSNSNACQFSNNGPTLDLSIAIGLPNMLDANTQAVFTNTISYDRTNCTSFTFNSDICTNTYNWNFGDPASGANNTSNTPNPTHVFTASGTYTVSLTATNGTTYTETIEIGLEAPVIAGSTCRNLNQNNTYSVSVLPGLDYAWTATGGNLVGATNTSSVDIAWTTLPATITLTVTDPLTGCSASNSLTVTENCSDPGPGGCTNWPKTYGLDEINEWGIDIRTDREGNVYALGKSNKEAVAFMETIPEGQNYQSNYFLARYSTNGCLEWIKGLRSATQLEIDGDDNLLVVRGSVEKGLISKYTPDGVHIWDIRIDTQNDIRISVDKKSNAIAAVITNGKNAFIKTPFDTYEAYPDNLEKVSVLANFRTDGHLMWYVIDEKINLHDVAYTPYGFIFAVGFNHPEAEVSFGNIEGGTAATGGCFSNGTICMTSVAYKNDGNFFGSHSQIVDQERPTGRIESWDRRRRVYISTNGKNVFTYNANLVPLASASYGNTVNLLAFNQKNHYFFIDNASFEEKYQLIKVDADLSLIWTKTIKSNNYGAISSLSMFEDRVYITGRYNGSTLFSNADVDSPSLLLDPIGLEDLYIVRLQDIAGDGVFENYSNLLPPTGSDISQSSLTTGLNLHPNPTANEVTISSQEPFHAYAIYDLNGRLINEMKVDETRETVVDFSHLEIGIYLIKVFTKEGILVEKVIKM